MIPHGQRFFRNVSAEQLPKEQPHWCAVNGWLFKGRGKGERLAQLASLQPSESGGANPCNTAPPLLHSLHSSGGIDCLELTIYGNVTDAYSSTVVRLIAEKEKLQQGDEHGCTTLAGGLWCNLKKAGSGVGFAHCPVLLVFQGIRLRMRERAPGTVSANPLMFIEIPGKALLDMGERKCIRLVQEFCAYLQIQSIKIAVRRVDLCVDLVGALRSRFRAAVRAGRFRSRAGGRIEEFYQRRLWTGFRVHGSLCALTVYDKLYEVIHESPEKLPAMIKYRWGGEQPAQAWRVEFRIRPTEKQRLEWSSFEQLLDGLGTLCHWACVSWFRLVNRIKKGHSEREALDSVWWDVVTAFGSWSSQYNHGFNERDRLPVSALKLAKCAYGVIAAMCVIAGVNPSGQSLEEILYECSRPRRGRVPDDPEYEEGEWDTLRMQFEERFETRSAGEGDAFVLDA